MGACVPPTTTPSEDDGSWALTSTFPTNAPGDAVSLSDGTFIVAVDAGLGVLRDDDGEVVHTTTANGCLLARLNAEGDVLWSRSIPVVEIAGEPFETFTCASVEKLDDDTVRASIGNYGGPKAVTVGELVESDDGLQVDVGIDGTLLAASATSVRGAATTVLDDGTQVRGGYDETLASTLLAFADDEPIVWEGVGSPRNYDFLALQPSGEDVVVAAQIIVGGELPIEDGTQAALSDGPSLRSLGALVGRVSRSGFVWAVLADAQRDDEVTAVFPAVITAQDGSLIVCGAVSQGATLRDVVTDVVLHSFDVDVITAVVVRLEASGALRSVERVGPGLVMDCALDGDSILWGTVDDYEAGAVRLTRLDDGEEPAFTAPIVAERRGEPFDITFSSFVIIAGGAPVVGVSLPHAVPLDAWVPGAQSADGRTWVVVRPSDDALDVP